VWFAATIAQRLAQVALERRADVVVLQKELISTVPTVEGFIRHPCLVDIDDAIHLFRGGRAARKLAAIADIVVVGNEWLAEVWRKWASAVEVIPTAIDTAVFSPSPLPMTPVIGWIGAGSNLPYLTKIAPALARVVQRYPKTVIAVCSDKRPDLPGLRVKYTPWSVETEGQFLSAISVGIMPLSDGQWEQGKCAFKMLQYMAAGRPCVVSPAFMNKRILRQSAVGLAAVTEDDWVNALCGMISEPKAAEQMGRAGRELAVKEYSVDVLASRFAAQLRKIAP
jgi:glycosyltransferase involved in cell wall biosynthesis